MIDWITETVFGRFISTLFISMLPVVELRLGLPYGIALDLDYSLALLAAILGNMLPVPFIIVYIHRVFEWIRKHWADLDRFITRLENKAHKKGETVRKYGALGLLIFVAIPLPGTGAWTGSLIAAVTNMRLRSAVLCILLGVCISAGIMTALTFGVIQIV